MQKSFRTNQTELMKFQNKEVKLRFKTTREILKRKTYIDIYTDIHKFT